MQPKEKIDVINQETTTSLITQDNPVRYDFQGWPEYQIRVIDLLKVLKIPTDNISKDILEKHIDVIEDDGLGYARKIYKAIDFDGDDNKVNILI